MPVLLQNHNNYYQMCRDLKLKHCLNMTSAHVHSGIKRSSHILRRRKIYKTVLTFKQSKLMVMLGGILFKIV